MRRYRTIAALLAAVPLLAFGPVERAAPSQWALLVGIDDYINFGDAEGGDLRGAEADARLMRSTLVKHLGFPEENVRMLLSGEATQAAIKAGITEWLATAVRPGDHVTIFFAGSGSQVWDEDNDEDDGLDESIAPADVLPDSPARDITDDMFSEWLAELPTDNVVVILDSGYADAGIRFPSPLFRSRSLGREMGALPRPRDVSRRAIPGLKDESGFDIGDSDVLQLAAAQPSQAAMDAYFPGIDGSEPFYGGAFTTFLVREIWKAPPGLSYQNLVERIAADLALHGLHQRPWLSEGGSWESPAFHVEGEGAETAQAWLSVRSVSHGRAELEGSVALGIGPGSVFETDEGALLMVESGDAASLATLIVEGSPKQGEAARLVGTQYTPRPLRVNVAGMDAEVLGVLSAAMGSDVGVELVQDPEAHSDLFVRRRGNELRVLSADGIVRHDAMGVSSTGAAELAVRLRHEATANRLAELDNPAPAFDVRVVLEAGKTDFAVGETVSFHVTSDRDGYLTLLDLGTDGKVVMLYPNAYEPAVRIRAGRTLSFPAEDMGFALEVFPPTGRRMVRAVVTPTLLFPPQDAEYPEGEEPFVSAVLSAVLRGAGLIGNAVRLDTWGTAALAYDIHN